MRLLIAGGALLMLGGVAAQAQPYGYPPDDPYRRPPRPAYDEPYRRPPPPPYDEPYGRPPPPRYADPYRPPPPPPMVCRVPFPQTTCYAGPGRPGSTCHCGPLPGIREFDRSYR